LRRISSQYDFLNKRLLEPDFEVIKHTSPDYNTDKCWSYQLTIKAQNIEKGKPITRHTQLQQAKIKQFDGSGLCLEQFKSIGSR
jgi:hypothetical protein